MERRVIAAVAVALCIFAAGITSCSSGESEPVRAESPTTTAPAEASPSIEVIYFNADPVSSVTRFVAAITNPSAQPLKGLVTEWIAYDVDDVIVGNRTKEQPTIPAGGTFNYVGGAGSLNLTGLPARVVVTVKNVGKLDAGEESAFLTVENAVLMPPEFSGGFGEATATVVSPATEVSKDSIDSTLILRDAAGNVVDADFDGEIAGPDVFPPDSKFGIKFYVSDFEAAPVSAEIQVFKGTGS